MYSIVVGHSSRIGSSSSGDSPSEESMLPDAFSRDFSLSLIWDVGGIVELRPPEFLISLFICPCGREVLGLRAESRWHLKSKKTSDCEAQKKKSYFLIEYWEGTDQIAENGGCISD